LIDLQLQLAKQLEEQRVCYRPKDQKLQDNEGFADADMGCWWSGELTGRSIAKCKELCITSEKVWNCRRWEMSTWHRKCQLWGSCAAEPQEMRGWEGLISAATWSGSCNLVGSTAEALQMFLADVLRLQAHRIKLLDSGAVLHRSRAQRSSTDSVFKDQHEALLWQQQAAPWSAVAQAMLDSVLRVSGDFSMGEKMRALETQVFDGSGNRSKIAAEVLAEAEYTKSSTWQRSAEIARARGADPRRVFAERPPEQGELLAIRGMQQALRIELDLADAQDRLAWRQELVLLSAESAILLARERQEPEQKLEELDAQIRKMRSFDSPSQTLSDHGWDSLNSP
jgi:hypothetical protein